MKRLTLLVATALVAVMLVAPAAFAQQTNGTMEQTIEQTIERTVEQTGMQGGQTAPATGPQTVAGTGAAGLPESGGPAILLPAAALLLGSGILTYAVLRRR